MYARVAPKSKKQVLTAPAEKYFSTDSSDLRVGERAITQYEDSVKSSKHIKKRNQSLEDTRRKTAINAKPDTLHAMSPAPSPRNKTRA